MHALLQLKVLVALLLRVRLSLKQAVEVSAVQSMQHLQSCFAAFERATPGPSSEAPCNLQYRSLQ